MKFPLFILAGFLLLVGVRTRSREFRAKLIEDCFVNRDQLQQEGGLWVHGQQYPLANTLENFISLLETYEAENPDISLEEEAFVLINNYTLENGKIRCSQNNDCSKMRLGTYKFEDRKVSDFPESWLEGYDIPEGEESFTEEEKCSLFFMMSHSVLFKPQNQVQVSGRNASYMLHSVIDEDEMYPQEIGVVSIRGSDYAVALSRVIYGIYMGLTEETKYSQYYLDKVYAVTLAGDVMMLNWPGASPIVGNGAWLSLSEDDAPLDTDSICPMVYKHDANARWFFTFSSLRGGADGLILGKLISEFKDLSEMKLSQVLRMYYSRNGIIRDDDVVASFCNRKDILDSSGENPYFSSLHDYLYNQTRLLAMAVKDNILSEDSVEDITGNSFATYERIRDRAYELRRDSDLYKYCKEIPSTEKVDTLELETPVDVLVIMDTDDEEDFRTQQLIVGHLARRLDLTYSGSRMTIAVDQRTDSSELELETIVNETYSSACAACFVSQSGFDPSDRIENYLVVTAVESILAAKKEEEDVLDGVKAKIVVYFNFQETEVETKRLKDALAFLHTNHEDVKIYAVGSSKDVLLKYARNNALMVVETKANVMEEDISKILFDRITNEPAILQYTECLTGNSEKGAVFEGLISPNGIQHWFMPAMYFHNSKNLKVIFEAPEDPIRVCYSRLTAKPENEIRNCKTTTTHNRRLEFQETNPCKGYNRINCDPLYFAVIGMENTDYNAEQSYCSDTQDTQCKTIYQTKFKVTHEGVRCSGCLGLAAAPVFLLLTFIITRVLTKEY